MEQGTLGERELTRSVIKHIRKQNKAIKSGAAVGNDYASISCGEKQIISTEGFSDAPHIAWTKALNNFATSGGIVLGVRIIAMLPDNIEEPFIKKYMSEFNKLSDETGVQIMGGHTQTGSEYSAPSFCVTAIGISGEYEPNIKEIECGDCIVMTKYTGVMGSDILAREKFEQLTTRFAPSYIRESFDYPEAYSVVSEAKICSDRWREFGVTYMHDVSHGGIYGGLWQLGYRIGKGIEIEHYSVPIKQHTVEICEFFDLNPYMLEGTGSLLVVAKDGEGLVSELLTNNIPAQIIGKVVSGKDKVVLSTERRFLSPVRGDEIYKIVKRGIYHEK